MGKYATKYLKVDAKKLIGKLNKALADEWLAYYQYWVGAKVAEGQLREAVVAELVEHAVDELRHAEMLADRILQLGGQPILEPKVWYEQTNCGYETPTNPQTVALLKQNIKGERCAIEVYQKLYDFVQGKDPVTEQLVREILTDEIEHEDDLETVLAEL